MPKIKATINGIFHNSWFPLVVLGFALLILHVFFNAIGDDVFFSTVLQDKSLPDYLLFRFQTWTSRVFIEAILVPLMQHGFWLWKILDVLVIVLLVITIAKLFTKKPTRELNWLIVLLFFVYPFSDMRTAGWGATTINYLWPLALGLFAMMPIKKHLQEAPIKRYEYFLYTAALLFATNMELMAGVLFLVYGVFTILSIRRHHFSRFWLLQLGLACASLSMILLCPGNQARKAQEIISYFPDFNMLSLLDKLEIGFSSTLSTFIFQPNLVFLIFSSLLCIAVWKKQSQLFYRSIGAIPLTAVLLFGCFAEPLAQISPNIAVISSALTNYGTIHVDNYVSLSSYLPIVILGSVLVTTILSFYLVFSERKTVYLAMMIFFLGFITRMTMSASPTIWASSTRTYIFFYFAIIICAFLIFQELHEKKLLTPTAVHLIFYGTGVAAFLNYLSMIGIL